MKTMDLQTAFETYKQLSNGVTSENFLPDETVIIRVN